MKETDVQFDSEYLRMLILENFGLNSISTFCVQSGIAKSALYGWFNGKSKRGPTTASWEKIIRAFEKKGKYISVSDFYKPISKDTVLEQSSNVSDLDSKQAKTISDELLIAKRVIEEKNQIIAEQQKEIQILRNEIQNTQKVYKP